MRKPPATRSLTGSLLVMLSAVLFGLMPLMAKGIYQGGCNGVTLTLLRSLLALPVLMLLAYGQQRSLKVPPRCLPLLAATGFLHCTTNLLLYTSYDYIPSGMSTTLHYVYPLVVAVLSAVFLRQRLGRWKKLGLAAGMAGVSFFMVGSSGDNLIGIALALLSGCTFGGYMLLVGAPRLSRLPCYVLGLYLALVNVAVAGGWGLVSGRLTLGLAPRTWLFALGFALILTIGATMFLQVGIRMTGANNAALLSLLEPITSVAVGVVFLSDTFTWAKGVGCGVILLGLLLSTVCPRLFPTRA